MPVDSNELTANLYFAATVRVAADTSLTRLIPLGLLKEPLAPHESFSQRILIALQALGVIEPELSLSNAHDWLMARDWIELGLDTLAWRICWAPRECRDRQEIAQELLRTIEPSEDTLEGLLLIWEDLALAEVAQYTKWMLTRSGYNPLWVPLAIPNLRLALASYSATQVMHLVNIAVRSVASTHQRGGVASSRLGEVLADSLGSFTRRASVERWTLRSLPRPLELPISAIAAMFAHEVTRLDDEYLTRAPSVASLLHAMTRVRTLH
jgi:hypothetical protein